MGLLEGLFGSKPDVPELPALDLGKEQAKAIDNNLAAMPKAQELVSQANLFNRDQIRQMLEATIPDYGPRTDKIWKTIDSQIAGELPEDVQDFIQNKAVSRAFGSGVAGSTAGRNIVARDLGLTSLDMTQRGLSSADNWLRTSAALFSPGMMNVTSMFVSPAQQAAFDIEERNAQFQRNWMSEQIDAMPDPVLRGVHDTIMSMAMAAGGSTYNGNFNSSQYMGGVNQGGVGGNNFAWANGGGQDMFDDGFDYGGGGGGGQSYDVGSWGDTGAGMDAGAGFGGGFGGMV
jgi:hypothetical protein